MVKVNLAARRALLKHAGAQGSALGILSQRWFAPAITMISLPAHGITSVVSISKTFPSKQATTVLTNTRIDRTDRNFDTVGATEGKGIFYMQGDSLSQNLPDTGLCKLTGLNLRFKMFDATGPNAFGAEHSFNFLVNNILVGVYSFESSGSGAAIGEFAILADYTTDHIEGIGVNGRDFELMIIATSTVPNGGGSWSWVSGGSVELIGASC